MKRLMLAVALIAVLFTAAAAKPGRAARVEYVRNLHEAFVRGVSPIDFALGDPDTTLLVVGPCNEKLLVKVKELTGENARNVGFAQLWCKNGNAQVDL